MQNYRLPGIQASYSSSSAKQSQKFEHSNIKLDRIVDVSPDLAADHACYLCGFYAVDPRQCFNITAAEVHCEALYCV